MRTPLRATVAPRSTSASTLEPMEPDEGDSTNGKPRSNSRVARGWPMAPKPTNKMGCRDPGAALPPLLPLLIGCVVLTWRLVSIGNPPPFLTSNEKLSLPVPPPPPPTCVVLELESQVSRFVSIRASSGDATRLPFKVGELCADTLVEFKVWGLSFRD